MTQSEFDAMFDDLKEAFRAFAIIDPDDSCDSPTSCELHPSSLEEKDNILPETKSHPEDDRVG